MDKSFTPKNIVQRYAFEKRSVDNQFEFQRQVQDKPYLIKRVTARNLWLNGISAGSRLGIIAALAKYLKVSIDDLAKDLK